MRKKIQIILSTLGILLVLLMSNGFFRTGIVKAVTEDNAKAQCMNEKTEQTITDFSKFDLDWLHQGYLYNKTDDYINIRCNETNFMYATFLLNISKYWINGTNANLEIKFDYNFTERAALLRFSFSTAYSLTGEPIGHWFDNQLLGYADLLEDDCRVATDFDDYRVKRTNHNMGLKNSATLHLKKYASSMKCAVKDNNGKTILSRIWGSLEYYIPINYVMITFMSYSAGNEVNITSIDGEIILQDRNWSAMILAYRIVIGVAITIVVVLALFGLFRLEKFIKKRSRFRRDEFYSKLNKNEISKDEYIARLEQALEK